MGDIHDSNALKTAMKTWGDEIGDNVEDQLGVALSLEQQKDPTGNILLKGALNTNEDLVRSVNASAALNLARAVSDGKTIERYSLEESGGGQANVSTYALLADFGRPGLVEGGAFLNLKREVWLVPTTSRIVTSEFTNLLEPHSNDILLADPKKEDPEGQYKTVLVPQAVLTDRGIVSRFVAIGEVRFQNPVNPQDKGFMISPEPVVNVASR